MRYESNYHSQVNFFKNIILLNDFCKLNDIPLLWVSTGFSGTADAVIEDKYKQARDLINLKEYANLDYAVDMITVAKKSKALKKA
jgi:hypothetical protein